MGDKTGIAWTDATWNPLRGCSKVSEGCRHCYAMGIAARFSGTGQPYEGLARMVGGKPQWTNKIMLVPEKLDEPLRWQKPRMIFVNSMSDLFHEDVPIEYIARVFAVMALAHWHTFQVLTKRPERMRVVLNDPAFGKVQKAAAYGIIEARPRLHTAYISDPTTTGGLFNVWLGTSIENNAVVGRADHLRETPAAVRFISAEPLLGPLDKLELRGIHWIITGGESGPNHRPFDPEWAREIRDRCHSNDIAFFHKQNGGATSHSGGNLLSGQRYQEYPRASTSISSGVTLQVLSI